MKIREASIADLNQMVILHNRSFNPEDHVPMILGEDYLRATFRWFLTSEMAYILVAEIENSLAGFVAICDKSYFKPMFIACFPEFLGSFIKNPGMIFSRILWRRLFRLQNGKHRKTNLSKAPGFAHLSVIAVDPYYRGRGIFGQLVQAAKVKSKSRGSRAIGAGVYKQNSTSRKVFSKAGWKEMDELNTYDTVYYVTFLDNEFKMFFNESININS